LVQNIGVGSEPQPFAAKSESVTQGVRTHALLDISSDADRADVDWDESSREQRKRSRQGGGANRSKDHEAAVLIVGADKGGVARHDHADDHSIISPRGHSGAGVRYRIPARDAQALPFRVTDIVDITSAPDQMGSSTRSPPAEVKMTVIDVRAGLLATTLQAFTDVDSSTRSTPASQFRLFHVLGLRSPRSPRSRHLSLYEGQELFPGEEFRQRDELFRLHPDIYENYFRSSRPGRDDHIPKLNELAYEQVELPACRSPPSSRTERAGQAVTNSLVLRGYVRHLALTTSARNSTAPMRSTGDGPDLWGCCRLRDAQG